MDPVVRFVLALAGALLGYWLGARFGAVAGVALGLLAGEVGVLRARLAGLESDLKNLRRRVSALGEPERDGVQTPAPAATQAPPKPVAPTVPPTIVSTATPARVDRPALAQPAARPALRRQPNLVDAIRRFFTGGNTLVRVGIIVLFFGVAFLLRYAAEHSHVPIELRLAGIGVGAIGLLGLGWWLRERRAGYAFALQGGAVGILYLTVFAALRLYELLPPGWAFVLLVLIAALSALLAILQNSQAFALLGACGGFLAPVLASTGEGSHVVLFSYFAVLNAGIVAIAWFRAWRPLNLLGFVFTFAIATSWGVLRYRAAEFATTEPFLVMFFLFYVGIAILFAHRPAQRSQGYVDGTLLFGTPMVAFGLQTAMLHQDPLMLAFSALGVSVVYLSLAAWLARRREAAQAVLLESCLAIGVVFLTLAIPLALGNRLNAAAWALEGGGLVWSGCRQSRRLARAPGLLLIVAAAGLVLEELRLTQGRWLLPAAGYAGVVLVGVAGMFSAWSLRRASAHLEPWEQLHAPGIFLIGLGCWCAGTLAELPHMLSPDAQLAAALAFLAATAVGLAELGRRTCLHDAAWAALWLLPVMWVFGLIDSISVAHWFAVGGWAAWPLSFACLYRIVWQHEGFLSGTVRQAEHAFAWLLLCALLSDEAQWLVSSIFNLRDDWALAALLLPPAVALLTLPRLVRGVPWPFGANRAAYIGDAGVLLGGILSLSVVGMNLVEGGNSAPLPWVPLLNPFDLASVLVVVALYVMARHLAAGDARDGLRLPRAVPASVLAAVVFVWCNGVLLRTLHHVLGIPMQFDALYDSNVVETSLSIFWSVLALVTMLMASRQGHRGSWMLGAALLGAVIGKLFFVDLSSIGSIERIISFVGVGLLMLVIGYFSPLPPRAGETS